METENNALIKEIEDLKKIIQKSLNLNTRIAKALNIIPMSEKEAKDLQVTQRKNLQVQEKVYEELNPEETFNEQTAQIIFSQGDLFGDVVAEDFLKGGK